MRFVINGISYTDDCSVDEFLSPNSRNEIPLSCSVPGNGSNVKAKSFKFLRLSRKFHYARLLFNFHFVCISLFLGTGRLIRAVARKYEFEGHRQLKRAVSKLRRGTNIIVSIYKVLYTRWMDEQMGGGIGVEGV